jgi:hypothetical protein
MVSEKLPNKNGAPSNRTMTVSIFAIVYSSVHGFQESCNVFRNFSFRRINSAFFTMFLSLSGRLMLEYCSRIPQNLAKARNQGHARRFGCYSRK